MKDITEGAKQLYEDAFYWHFINKGRPEWKAKIQASEKMEKQV